MIELIYDGPNDTICPNSAMIVRDDNELLLQLPSETRKILSEGLIDHNNHILFKTPNTYLGNSYVISILTKKTGKFTDFHNSVLGYKVISYNDVLHLFTENNEYWYFGEKVPDNTWFEKSFNYNTELLLLFIRHIRPENYSNVLVNYGRPFFPGPKVVPEVQPVRSVGHYDIQINCIGRHE